MSKLLILLLAILVGVSLGFVVFVMPMLVPAYPVEGAVYLCSSASGDQPGGVPIYGVTVTFNGAYPVKSDFNGKWSVDLPAGTYAVHGALTGYSSFDGTLVVDGPETYNQVCLVPMVGR